MPKLTTQQGSVSTQLTHAERISNTFEPFELGPRPSIATMAPFSYHEANGSVLKETNLDVVMVHHDAWTVWSIAPVATTCVKIWENACVHMRMCAWVRACEEANLSTRSCRRWPCGPSPRPTSLLQLKRISAHGIHTRNPRTKVPEWPVLPSFTEQHDVLGSWKWYLRREKPIERCVGHA